MTKILLLQFLILGMCSFAQASNGEDTGEGIIKITTEMQTAYDEYAEVGEEDDGILTGQDTFTSCQNYSQPWNSLDPKVAVKEWKAYLAKNMVEEIESVNDSIGKGVGEFFDDGISANTIDQFKKCEDNKAVCSVVKSHAFYVTKAAISEDILEPQESCSNLTKFVVSINDKCYKFKRGDITDYPEHFVKRGTIDKLETKLMSAFKKVESAGKGALSEIRECIAYQAVMSTSGQRSMNVSDHNKTAKATSFDKKIVCTAAGYETQDYVSCKTAVNFYDAIFMGRKAVETVQQFDYMDKTMDIQTDLAKNAQTDAAAGLKAQKQNIEQKAEMARVRAASEATAAGLLWHAMSEIPDLDKLTTSCQTVAKGAKHKESFKEVHDLFVAQMKEVNKIIANQQNTNTIAAIEGYEFSGNKNCQDYIGNVGGGAAHAMINNAEAKQNMQQALIDAGMQAVTMLGTAEILDKQAGRVGDAIKGVQDHDPETLTYDGEDILATECQINPGSENCVNAQYERGVDYYDQGINVDGMQFATSDATNDLDDLGKRNVDNSNGDSTDRKNSVGGMGDTVNGVNKGSGLAEGPAGAASVKSTGANGIGAGGGGGSAGGGGASAPGNGSAKTGGQGGNKPYVGSSKKIGYSGGAGSLSYRGGGSKRTRKAKAKNPFGNLFGKKGKKKGGVMNFRGMASKIGPKNGSIFNMISKRYSSVTKDKRLEEYQKVNGDLR